MRTVDTDIHVFILTRRGEVGRETENEGYHFHQLFWFSSIDRTHLVRSQEQGNWRLCSLEALHVMARGMNCVFLVVFSKLLFECGFVLHF